MHMFRTSSLLARLILAWLVLTVGVAIASPLVHPQAMELVCTTGSAVKLVVLGDDDGGAMDSSHHTLDCPACLHFSAPAPHEHTSAHHRQPLQPAVAATIAVLVGAPLPPRGPPALVS